MSRPEYWKCPTCDDINPMSHSKCRCGESKDSIRKYIEAETNSGVGGGWFAIIVALVTIILLYTCLTTIVADYCVEKRMAYPGQYIKLKSGSYTDYGKLGLDGYRLIIDIICYIILPIILLGYAGLINNGNESLLTAFWAYVIIIVASYLILRFMTLKRVIIGVLVGGGLWVIIMALTSERRMQNYRESTPTTNSYRYEPETKKEPTEEEILQGAIDKLSAGIDYDILSFEEQNALDNAAFFRKFKNFDEYKVKFYLDWQHEHKKDYGSSERFLTDQIDYITGHNPKDDSEDGE